MSDAEAPAPALELHELVVRAVIGRDAPVSQSARDLPDLARFLFEALGAAAEREVKVLDKLSACVEAGACLALVGEDGAGKSMLTRVCARLTRPDEGRVTLGGVDIYGRHGLGLEVRRRLQVIFADPESSLDPRRTVGATFADTARALRLDDVPARIAAALLRARLEGDVLDRRPAHLSAGHKRQVALARALLPAPSVIVVDEPTSGLDPFERVRVLETLADVLRQPAAPGLLLLTRDLAAARALARRVGVLRRGKLIEIDHTERVFLAPAHPYAQALVAAAPNSRPRPRDAMVRHDD